MKEQAFSIGQEIAIDQGFGSFTFGIVKAYDGVTKNMMGHIGNYTIEITGGLDCFGKEVVAGEIHEVLGSNLLTMEDLEEL